LRWAAASVAAAALVLGAAVASAQPRPAPRAAVTKPSAPAEVQGTVLALDKDDLILDVGSDAGAIENLIVELWRPLKLKHPVTGKIFADRFKIGQIQLGQVRATMSLAKPSGSLSRAAAPGDLVIFNRAGVTPSSPPVILPTPPSGPTDPYGETPPETGTSVAAAPVDMDAKSVTDMFESLRGQNIATRVQRYEEFLRAHPQSRFFTVLFEENIALKRLLKQPAPAPFEARSSLFLVNGPGWITAVPGQPLRVAVELNEGAHGAVLQVRRRGEILYLSLPMTRAGQGYFAAVVPSDRVVDRGLEYFIEGVGSEGTRSLVGTARSPKTIDVEPHPKASPPPGGIGSLSVLTDYADYNRLIGNDYVWQTEGIFGIRFKDLGIRAVRMGFGVYRGVSGTVEELDELGMEGRPVGLTYGFVESEIGIHKLFSLTGRIMVGLLDDGVGGGGQLFARIGSDQKTNLLIGGELLGGVGLRSIVELQLNTFERFPIVLRTEVTNQPAGAAPSPSQRGLNIAEGPSDVAGRGIAQLGFRIVPELTIAVRGSFQGRNINHAGPGVGGSVGYTW